MALVAISTTTVAAITGGGPAQAISIDCGGLTPKGVIIRATRGVTVGTIADGATICEGYSDGTNQRVNTGMAQDATAANTHVTQRRFDSGKIVQICQTGSNAIDGEAAFTSFAANTVTITWSTLPTLAYQLCVTVFYGTVCQVAVGDYAGATTDGGTTTVSGLAFKPRMIFFSTALNTPSAGGSATTSDRLGFGFTSVDNDGTTIRQACTGFMCRTGGIAGPVTASGQVLYTTRSLSRLVTSSAGSASAEVNHEVTEFKSDGFVVTSRDTAGGIAMNGSYLAVYTGGMRAWVGAPTITTSGTGSPSITGVGFKPQAVFAIGTLLPALDTANSGQPAGHVSLGQCGNGAQNSAGYQYEDATTPSDTRSQITSKLISVMDDTGVIAWSASLTSFDTDGFTINVDDASSADAFAAFMALEQDFMVVSETEQISDSAAIMLAEALSETEQISDSPAMMLAEALSETVEIGDSPAFMLADATSETEEISDYAVLITTAATDLLLVISEDISISDDVAFAGVMALSETVEIFEAFNFSGSAVLVFSETEEISDAPYLYLGNVIATTETVEIHDEHSFGRGLIASMAGQRGTSAQGGAVAGSAASAHAERGEVLR